LQVTTISKNQKPSYEIFR